MAATHTLAQSDPRVLTLDLNDFARNSYGMTTRVIDHMLGPHHPAKAELQIANKDLPNMLPGSGQRDERHMGDWKAADCDLRRKVMRTFEQMGSVPSTRAAKLLSLRREMGYGNGTMTT